jgi:hypothetical protein
MSETTTDYQQLAQEILQTLRSLRERIPGFAILTLEERRKYLIHAHLPVAFLNGAATALDVSERLTMSAGLTGAAVRDAIAFRNAMQPVGNEADLFRDGVHHTVLRSLGQVGAAAYRAYTISKTMNRADDREVLIPHIEAMRRSVPVRSRASSEATEPEVPEPTGDPGNGPKK